MTSRNRDDAAAWPELSEAMRSVLLELLIHGPLPRTELARRLRLSKPSLTRLTRALVDGGFLAEGATQQRTALGRPSEMLHVIPDARHFAGVKLTGDRLYLVVTDLTAAIVAAHEEPLTRPADVPTTVAQIAAAVDRLRPRHRIAALGVSLAGVMIGSGADRRVVHSDFLNWHDVPLAQLLQQATGLPTVFDNDAQALTASLHWFGPGVGLDSMALLTIGVGIGCGLIVNGRRITGAHGLPGRVSHLVVDPEGKECDLGHRGCATMYLINESIAANVPPAAGQPQDYDTAVRRARSGDAGALAAFASAGFALGAIIAVIADLVDPQRFILSGDGLAVWDLAAAEVRRGIAAFQEGDEPIDIDVQPFDFSEWARSAAAIAIRAQLDPE